VPFDFQHHQILIQVRVNGRGPYNFVLDTGTHNSTVDIRLARRLRLPLGSEQHEGTGPASAGLSGGPPCAGS